MDNMKARGFIEAEMPLLAGDDPAARVALLRHATRLARAATDAAGLLRGAVRSALAEGADADVTLPAAVRDRFFEATSPVFWNALDAARSRGEDAETEAAARGWLDVLRRHALAGFDAAAPLDPLSPAAAGRPDPRTGGWRPPPVVEARRNLGLALHGWGMGGQALFAHLGLEPPTPTKRDKEGRAP